MTAKIIRAKRAAAGITGQAISQLAGISRAKLSDIEREYIAATPEELQRIDGAIEQISSFLGLLPEASNIIAPKAPSSVRSSAMGIVARVAGT